MRDPTVTPGREVALERENQKLKSQIQEARQRPETRPAGDSDLEQRNQELKNQIQESEARLASIIRFYKERECVHLEEIYEHREFWARRQRAQEQPEEQPPQAGPRSPQG